MNRLSYRLVFNRSLGALVAVAECARGRGKSPSASGARGATTVLLGSLLMGAPAWAETPIPGVNPGGNFATFGQAGTQLNGNQLLVNQVGNKSILNWQKFNISPGAGVQFRQVNNLTDNALVPGASFTSLNRIWDINPSVIAGSITQGAGQQANIILVNSNGIAFMGGSQVNLNSFTATTLNMADKFVTDRLLGDLTTPQFAGALDGGQARGFVKVFEGANITADSQGRVMLIAPTVVNRGNVSAPDGQVILAAGTKAYLRADDASNNLELRGLLVEVDNDGLTHLAFNADNTTVTDGELDGVPVNLRSAGDDKLGHATNFGALSSARGNVTMVGYAVNQNGIARATSSVVANGSVYLMAKDSLVPSPVPGGTPDASRFGQVVMGAGSLTEVLPEVADTTTTTDGTQGAGQATPSEVRVLGRQIYMASGSTIRTPGGEVGLTATEQATEVLGGQVTVDPNSTGQSDSGARVHVAAGATIDVAGLRGVQVSAARNTLEVELRGDELKDSPVNQTGPLRGQKAWVDVQQALDNAQAGVETLIAQDSLEAYAQRLERNIAERSTAGGRVVLDSAGSVIVENGATIDLSGGSIAYQQDTAKTTVLSSSGRLTDLADAVATTRYDGIVSQYTVNYGRWNQSETIELPSAQRVVRGYTDGQDAGSLVVFSRGATYLQPNLVGSTVAGERQQASGNLPRGAQLYLGQSPEGLQGNRLAQNVVIDRTSVNLPAGFGMGSDLPEVLKGTLTIDADLLAEGRVAELSVLTSQAAEVRSALRAPSGGQVGIGAQSIQVNADIAVAGGDIALNASNFAGGTASTRVAVADGVTLSTSGTWVNRLPGVQGAGVAPVLEGGDISISAASAVVDGQYLGEGSVSFGQGVRLDTSGGAMLTERGQLRDGAAGDITLSAYQLSGLEGSSLSAYGVNEGGSLNITTQNIHIGGEAPAVPVAGNLHLASDFFGLGGFAGYDLRALETLEVADNTTVRPVVAQRNLNADFGRQATGASMAAISTPGVRDPLQRQGADISLTALNNATDSGDLRIGEGARIEVDPGASISLTGRKRLTVEGSLVARGGEISATLASRPGGGFENASLPQGNLFLGDSAVIDASGVAQTETNAQGQRQGRVLAGGSVKLLASAGALVTRAGSRIDVSGAAPVTLGERNESGGLGREVASDAGRVSLRGNNLFLDGALQARAGSGQQRGGSLELGSATEGSLPANSALLANTATNLELSNRLDAQAQGLTSETVIAGNSLRVATDPLETAGFDRLRFTSNDGIVLSDGLDLGNPQLRELQLDAARIQTRGDATLAADAVRLGNYLEGTRVGSAGDSTANGGTLTANARLLELTGNLRLQGMDRSELTGSERLQFSGVTNQTVTFNNNAAGVTGPFRHTARIQSEGDLLLRGGVVAPGGFADVQLQAVGRDVRIESSGAAPVVPMSALGQLSIEAQNITQAGYLVAPFGQISLNATGNLNLEPGSVTSVAGTPGQVLPVGQLLNGLDWQVNLKPGVAGAGQTQLGELPGKELRLSGAQVSLKSGATVNVAGGGDLQAYEFTAGPGGSRDILTDANTYAILPGYQSGFAPSEAQEKTGLDVGEAVYLRGVQGLADGSYVLLPAHYALLPGAMAVRLNGDAAPIPGQNLTRQDGIQVVAGYRTDSRGNAPRSGDWQGVQVLTNEQVTARSEFTLARASTFFADAGGVPQDAGLLSLVTQSQLQLDASILGAGAAGGKGLAVDLSAPNLLITNGSAGVVPAGTTLLNVDQLSALNASSLLLGATRETTADGTELTVSANAVTLQNSDQGALRAPEVMLAARDAVTLASGSFIDAQGSDGDAGTYTTEGNGAFVRAAATTARFNRTGSPDRSAGALNGAADSVIQAAKSITVDATQANDYTGQTLFRVNGEDVAGELSIGATRISFGDPVQAPEGITLGQDALAALQDLASLSLTSYSNFDLYGGAEVGGLGADGRPLLGQLTLEGGGLTGLTGQAPAERTVSLRARELTLNNTAASPSGLPATQPALLNGTLNIEAEKLSLGTGEKTVDGFAAVNIRARDIVGDATGRTTVNGQIAIQTDRLTATTKAQQTLDAVSNGLTVTQLNSSTPLTESTGLGARWTLKGGSVELDTLAALRSGVVTLEAATGDVMLGENAVIDVSGRDVAFFNESRGTWGGDVNLSAAQGSVRVQDDATTQAQALIKLSGAAGADGGTLTVQAANGQADLGALQVQGQARAGADGQRGDGARLRVDAGELLRFSALSAVLNNGGVDGEISLRSRNTGLTVAAGDVVQARNVTLTADGGELRVEGTGTVSASGDEAGTVALHGRSVTLASGARVEARSSAQGAEGGRVEIAAATQANKANAGRIDLQAGSEIDVSGGSGGVGGTVHLRAQRTGGDAQGNETGVAVTALASTITGAREVNLEAVRVYNKTGNLALDVSTTNNNTTLGLTGINTANNSYANHHAAIETALGQTANPAFHVLSGVEIRSTGDITLGTGAATTDWDLGNSAAGGEPGVLTLRAGGNLNIHSNLSDGFSSAIAVGTGTNPAIPTVLPNTVRGGRSWSYNLVAGADAASADVMGTQAGAGTFKLGTGTLDADDNLQSAGVGKLIRTGTGDIRVAAGRNIRFTSKDSVIYTAGRESDPLSDYQNPSGPSNIANPRAFFTQDGGDIHMVARGDVSGVRSEQLYSEWLWRTGRVAADGLTYLPVAPESGNSGQVNQGQTAWWVRFDQFRQGVATLGGGDVTVVAGGDVRDLSVSAPTQGRMNSATVDPSKLVKTGGGQVRVEAGRDLLGGQYFADEGDVVLRAGQNVGSGSQVGGLDLNPILAVGNGEARVQAVADVTLQAVVNPTLLRQSASTANSSLVTNIKGTNTENRKAVFSTYGEDSGAVAQSLTGDVVLSAFGSEGVTTLSSAYALFTDTVLGNVNSDLGALVGFMPPRLAMTAFAGDVELKGPANSTQWPSPEGQLELLAMDSVQFGSHEWFISDRDPAAVPSAARPAGYRDAALVELIGGTGRVNATVPVHAGDPSIAKVYAVEGDVTAWEGSDIKTAVSLTSSKAVEVRAGRDIADLNLRIQHANASDRSVVQAGRDVYFTPAALGNRSEDAGIRVGGLGNLEVTAGRDVNLGASGGILSRGDLDNNNLPLGGASIQVMAGAGAMGLDAVATLERLADRVSTGTVSDTDLWLVRWLVGNDSLEAADAAAAVAGVRSQGEQAQRDQVRDMLFTALRAAGRAANVRDSGYAGSFDRGYAALELAFPGVSDKGPDGEFTGYEGGINLFASRINTARGGNIDLLVPGGGMVVGLANTPELLTRLDPTNSPGPLGVVASSTGDIRGFTRDDMLVNQSRILTVGGGDILLWSSEGNLDAGKGKKTATTVPPPVIRISAEGTVTQELQGAATGSGIGALKTGNTEAGDVDLIAPKGTVNAGDAGIRAGNLNIAALVVLGADNISVSGSSTGTPVADTSAVTAATSGATTGGDDTASVVESLNQAAAEQAKAAQELAEALRPYVVRVEVLGYGE